MLRLLGQLLPQRTPRSIAMAGRRLLSTPSPFEPRILGSGTLRLVSQTATELILDLGDSLPSRFDYLWLHDHCTCAACLHPTSRQKLRGHQTSTFSELERLKPRSIAIHPDKLIVQWDQQTGTSTGPHETTFTTDTLRALSLHQFHRMQRRDRRSPSLWPAHVTKDFLPEFRHDHLTSTDTEISGKAQFQWMEALNTKGAAMVRNVPPVPGTMKPVAQLLGPLMPTVYGELFDVIAVPTPINVAYSPLRLEPHLDILYYEAPPGLQLLHCIRFDDSVKGGESTLLDGFAVARALQKTDPDAFRVLARVAATFHKIDPIHHIKFRRTHIDYNEENDEILGIYWSPPFEGPLECDPSDVRPFYLAYRKFSDMMNDPSFHIRFRLQPGDMISFNNRRILHARDEFVVPEGAERYLQGTYVRMDEYLHNYRLLLRKYHPEKEHLDVQLAGIRSY